MRTCNETRLVLNGAAGVCCSVVFCLKKRRLDDRFTDFFMNYCDDITMILINNG